MPENVTLMLDRHGKPRLRFRKTGHKTHYFKEPYPSKGFWEEYEACQAGAISPEPVGRARTVPGSVNDLMARYLSVPARLGPSAATQYKVRQILENDFRLFVTPKGGIVGDKMVADCDFEALDTIIAKKAEAAPWQAKKLRRHLRNLFKFAVKTKMIDHNPADDTETVKTGKSRGWHTWTEAEIAQFIKRHPLGTKPYLALMLMLWTFQRRSDAIRMAPAHVLDGRIAVEQAKGMHLGKGELRIAIAPKLVEAITAISREPNLSPETPYLLTALGKPFTPAGFGNWFRKRCDEAGLSQCSAHGLRKAASRRAAEIGLSNQTIKAVTGHVNDDEVALYTAAADQKRLADAAIEALTQWDLSNHGR